MCLHLCVSHAILPSFISFFLLLSSICLFRPSLTCLFLFYLFLFFICLFVFQRYTKGLWIWMEWDVGGILEELEEEKL